MNFPPMGEDSTSTDPKWFTKENERMKAQLSKQTGIALALLATLMATLLAMGVYSVVAQAQTTHSANRTFSATTVEPGDELTVTVAISGDRNFATVEETLPSGFSYASTDFGGIVREGNNKVIFVFGGAGTSVSYKVTAPDTEGTFTFSGVFTGRTDDGDFSVTILGDSMVTVAMDATDGDDEAGTGIELNTQEPGAAVQITITDSADPAILPDEQIEMDLSGFSVPATIADSDISISSEGYRGNPSNVVVNGSTVTMTVPNVKANGDDQRESVRGDYTIRIKQSAGVTNAASGGSKTVSWQENAPDGAEKEATVTIQRVIKLSATAGTRGTMTTATFKGFANGSATVKLNGKKLDEVTITDNTGTLEIDTTSTSFKANEDNRITAQDAAGNPQTAVDDDDDGAAVFTISPKAVVDPEESPVSKEVTIKLSDWPATNTIDEVTIGASTDVTEADTAQATGSDGKAEFKVMVPANANRGTQTVKVTGSESAEGADDAPSATASLSVGVLALTVQPAMVVPGQQITIEGSGLQVAGDKISSVKHWKPDCRR